MRIEFRGHDVVVLFSEASRRAYVAEAIAASQTYTFDSAWDEQRTWVKGEYAYLAPNAASLFLGRCNLKHDLVEEADLDVQRIAAVRLLLVPNASHLMPATIELIRRWLEQPPRDRAGQRWLFVTGKTNLPPDLLGLAGYQEIEPRGFTGWRWLEGSAFASPDWASSYVSAYAGHRAARIAPAAGARVHAELLEFSGDLADPQHTGEAPLGPAIVTTARSCYIANQVFEMIGAMMQAHLNVEAIRHRVNPTHWGDTLLFFMRRLLLDIGADVLWQTRLRSFGTHDGVLSFRHDVHGMRDFTFLDY